MIEFYLATQPKMFLKPQGKLLHCRTKSIEGNPPIRNVFVGLGRFFGRNSFQHFPIFKKKESSWKHKRFLTSLKRDWLKSLNPAAQEGVCLPCKYLYFIKSVLLDLLLNVNWSIQHGRGTSKNNARWKQDDSNFFRLRMHLLEEFMHKISNGPLESSR